MVCPKCKESFDEASRRFCPNDGTWLVTEGGYVKSKESISANPIPQIDTRGELNQSNADVPRFVVNEPNGSRNVDTKNGRGVNEIYFEVSDVELEMEQDVLPKPLRPLGRKVNPREIPKGHADLGDVDRYTGPAADFNERDPESFVGRVVKGRYKVIEFLGGDENGLAYLADDQIVDDKKVLVRILIGAESDEIMNSILSEERVSLSHFSHPNIARLIDSGQFTKGPHFLVSEYVDALSVKEILHIHGHVDRIRAARIIKQAANALNEAHQEGILHRDVRPENIIINSLEDEPEQTKLVNFGASTGEHNPHNLGYKAQEVLDGRIATIASDVHSLAVVAYQMITGRMPFTGDSPRDIVRAQKAGLKVHPTDIRPELPTGVDAVFDKAFSLNAVDRYPRARDLGDAFYSALTSVPANSAAVLPPAAIPPALVSETPKPKLPAPAPLADRVKPLNLNLFEAPVTQPLVRHPAWLHQLPEPPKKQGNRSRTLAVIAGLALLTAIAAIWYYMASDPVQDPVPKENTLVNPSTLNITAAGEPVMPPQPRTVPQPPDTIFYQNDKQNLKGDLLRNFVGFTLYYPKDWKVNGPQEGNENTRGKFLDITSETKDGRLKEQMLISYYESKGTYPDDADRFPGLVNETNATLATLLPDYKMILQGPTRVNGDWRAHEIRFEGGGTSPSRGKLTVWGRRLYIPAARPGTRNGFEVTMLATSLAEGVTSADDVGLKGDLAQILYSFEPSQDF